MSKQKINFLSLFQEWLDGNNGQTFLNYAYSWGAAVVILGALFKLTHLSGADIMLYIGMGTEVIVFILSAFDRPKAQKECVIKFEGEYEELLNESRKHLIEDIHLLAMEYDKQIHECSEALIEISRMKDQIKTLVEKLHDMNILFSNMAHALRP